MMQEGARAEMQGSRVGPRKNPVVFQKTRLCRFFLQGRCLRGPDCSFAHGREQLRAQPDFTKTKMCPDFMMSGGCKNGGACTFAHGSEEVRRMVKIAGSSSPTTQANAIIDAAGSDPQAVHCRIEVLRGMLMQTQFRLQQVQALNERFTAFLQQDGALAGTPGKRPCSPSSSESDDDLSCPMDLSRQSTEEGADSLLSFGSLPFSRQTTSNDCGLSEAQQSFSRQTTTANDEDVAGSPVISATALKVVPLKYSVQHGVFQQLATVTGNIPKGAVPLAADVEAPVDLKVPEGFKATVKNTFIQVEPVNKEMPRGRDLRRSRSAPAPSRPALL